MDERELERVALGALESLWRMPAIPYYEDAGAVFVREFCSEAGLVVEADRHGNVLARRPGRDAGAPGLAFVHGVRLAPTSPWVRHKSAQGFEVGGACDGRGIVVTGSADGMELLWLVCRVEKLSTHLKGNYLVPVSVQDHYRAIDLANFREGVVLALD